MEQIDRLAISGKIGKVLCRNSYERRKYHEYAQSKGLSHRSITNYYTYHINEDLKIETDSRCCQECNLYKVVITGTPFSYVEINNGYEKEIIGTPNLAPSPVKGFFYGSFISNNINRIKEEYKRKCPKLPVGSATLSKRHFMSRPKKKRNVIKHVMISLLIRNELPTELIYTIVNAVDN